MEGQISLFTKQPLQIKGLMDDGYCPVCGYYFDELKELDMDRCPKCLTAVDWTMWHRMNDKTEVKQ